MKIRFILNPVSGNRPLDFEALQAKIASLFPGSDLCVTEGPGHATKLAKEAAEQKFDVAVAMGGDGTINEVLQGVLGTSTALGIIPLGSGNGFARELGLMGSWEKALVKLQKAFLQPCDVGFANGEPFLNLAGVGFEAVVAWKYMEYCKTKKRGMLHYFTLAAKTLLFYKPPVIRVTVNEEHYSWAPLSMVVANNRQYGSNFVIAPSAVIADGKLDLVVIKDVWKLKLLAALPSFFLGKTPPFGVTAYATTQSVVIESNQEILYHIDGEPRKAANRLEITLRPHALRLWAP